MIDILIDMTKGNKRSRSGIALCHYCRPDLFPRGKMIDVAEDKNAKQMPNGQWKCSTCLHEDLEKTTKLMNRRIT
jgi:hypothetical protein